MWTCLIPASIVDEEEQKMRRPRHFWPVALLVATAVPLPVASGASGAAPTRASGTLQLRATFKDALYENACPPGAPRSPNTECFTVTGGGLVPGLGKATVTWMLIADVSSGLSCEHFDFTTIVVDVAGKGKIEASLTDPKTHCWPRPPAVYGPFKGTITGGFGRYAGASGNLQVTENFTNEVGGAGDAVETWVGALAVPGLEFDLTPPTVRGAHNRTVRAPGAKRVRVRYAVAGKDAEDGLVRASCTPRSGSLFKRGRTTVRCSATDTSGNRAKATFVVAVKR
jgi:hypothetical protein